MLNAQTIGGNKSEKCVCAEGCLRFALALADTFALNPL